MSLAACFLFGAIYLFYAGTAFAAATYTVAADGTGCSAIGAWDAGTSTCTLTSDITLGSDDNDNAIELVGDSMNLVGAGHVLTGKGGIGNGVSVTGHGNFSIRGLTIQHFQYGLSLDSTTFISDKSHVASNIITSNSFGIYLHFASEVSIESNTLDSNSAANILFSSACNNDEIISNVIQRSMSGVSIMGGSSGLFISRNLVTGNTYPGISLNSVGSSQVTNNYISSNGSNGIEMVATGSNDVRDNIIIGNGYGIGTGSGIFLNDSTADAVFNNDFIGNANQATYTGSGTGTVFNRAPYGGNYWYPHTGSSGPCVNNNADDFCDGPMIVSSSPLMQDNSAFALRNGWGSKYFTWYDNVAGDNWVLGAVADNSVPAPTNAWLDLYIGGGAQDAGLLASADCPPYGCWPGQLPVGYTIFSQHDLQGGPVELDSRDGTRIIASERTLWPKGGSSLEEVPAIDSHDLSSHYWWPWYDEASPGFQNWILLDNPNNFDIDYTIKLAGTTLTSSTLAAGSAPYTPEFPGHRDGPLEVTAYVHGTWNPAKIIASQRVLTGGGRAFNEVPGIPDSSLSDDNVWTWYDNVSGQNWILIANPSASATMHFQVEVADGCSYGPWPPGTDMSAKACVTSGTTDNPPDIPPGQKATFMLAGKRGGRVEVKTTDAGLGTPLRAIVSQRSLWGSSFEEVPGLPLSSATHKYQWTWYDEASPGSANWVLVANLGLSAVYYRVSIAGTPVGSCQSLDPGAEQTPDFPGQLNGPVEVKSYSDSSCSVETPGLLLASQRVLWNGYFNEVFGYPLN